MESGRPEIPVFIICYNNHLYVKQTIEQLKKYGVHNIHVIDNNSPWVETQLYLNSIEHEVEVIRFAVNYTSHVIYNVLWDRLPDKFIVTDPDLLYHPEIPSNFIQILDDLSEKYQAYKVGFALDISEPEELYQDIYAKDDKEYTIHSWEEQFWNRKSYLKQFTTRVSCILQSSTI